MKKLFIILSVVCSLAIVGNAVAGSDADANADAGATITDNSSQKNTNYDRKFVIPGNIPLPMTNGFFTAPTPDSSFRSIKDILRVFGDGNTLKISEGALEKSAKGGDVDLHLQIVRGDEAVPRVYTKDFKGDKWLTIGIEKPIFEKGKLIGTERLEGLNVTGLIDGESDDAETNSLQVIGKVGLKALADGNNFLIITAEGAHRKVEASGWGIGTYTVYGGNWDNGKQSGGGGGGLGYASNETGPEDRPWIQGYVGCKE